MKPVRYSGFAFIVLSVVVISSFISYRAEAVDPSNSIPTAITPVQHGANRGSGTLQGTEAAKIAPEMEKAADQPLKIQPSKANNNNSYTIPNNNGIFTKWLEKHLVLGVELSLFFVVFLFTFFHVRGKQKKADANLK